MNTMGPRLCLAASVSAILFSASPAAAAEADALAISQIIQARHLPHQTILDPFFDSPTGDRVVSYTRCGDSALWTGFYLAAESYRYAVTRQPAALENARAAFDGLRMLVDATGTDLLARCSLPDGSPYAAAIQSEEAHNRIYRSRSGSFWVGNTSRDQYSGALFGLGVAYELIDDQPLRSSIAELVTRMVRYLDEHEWSLSFPDGRQGTTFIIRPDQQLAFLQLARRVNPAVFTAAYDSARASLGSSVALPISVDTFSNESYFKFNLNAINLYALIHYDDGSGAPLYHNAYSVFRKHTAGHGNAFFNIIDRALNGPNASRDAETRLLLDQWLQRPRRDLRIDNRGRLPACGSDAACQPIPVPDRITTDFLWQRSPFQLANLGGENTIEGPGIDYILPYWMARFHGVVPPDSMWIGSAASAVALLAPEAIGSIYGAPAQAAISAAPSQPLPLNLSGVSLSVKDSAGVTRGAPLYFVSPGQVNFLAPARTAFGIAAFTLQSPGAPDVTISAEVRAVAPALFTAAASGSGVAAATAVRVVGERQVPVPVFSCGPQGCSAEPISLTATEPVYLTLYGSGIRNRGGVDAVKCEIGGVAVPVLYAGPQPEYAGLDQVNVALPISLSGMGEADMRVTVDGRAANTVRVAIR